MIQISPDHHFIHVSEQLKQTGQMTSVLGGLYTELTCSRTCKYQEVKIHPELDW